MKRLAILTTLVVVLGAMFLSQAADTIEAGLDIRHQVRFDLPIEVEPPKGEEDPPKGEEEPDPISQAAAGLRSRDRGERGRFRAAFIVAVDAVANATEEELESAFGSLTITRESDCIFEGSIEFSLIEVDEEGDFGGGNIAVFDGRIRARDGRDTRSEGFTIDCMTGLPDPLAEIPDLQADDEVTMTLFLADGSTVVEVTNPTDKTTPVDFSGFVNRR